MLSVFPNNIKLLFYIEMINKLHEFHKFELPDEEINAEKVITGTQRDKNVTYTVSAQSN